MRPGRCLSPPHRPLGGVDQGNQLLDALIVGIPKLDRKRQVLTGALERCDQVNKIGTLVKVALDRSWRQPPVPGLWWERHQFFVVCIASRSR